MKRTLYILTITTAVLLGFTLAIGSTIGQGFISGTASAGGSPAGSFNEYQFRSNSSTFGAAANTGPVSGSGWTAVNFGGLTTINDFSQDGIGIGIGNVVLALAVRLYCQPISATPFSAIETLDIQSFRNNGGTSVMGMQLYDGTKVESIDSVWQGGTQDYGVLQVDTYATVSTSPSALGSAQYWQSRVTVKVSDDGTTRLWQYWNQTAWVTLVAEASGSFLTPTNVCFGGFAEDGSAPNSPGISATLRYFCKANSAMCNGN